MDPVLALVLILAYLGLITACAVMLIFVVQVRRLLHQFRKLAAQFPPYPVYDDKDGEAKDSTSAQINDQWNEDSPGRD